MSRGLGVGLIHWLQASDAAPARRRGIARVADAGDRRGSPRKNGALGTTSGRSGTPVECTGPGSDVDGRRCVRLSRHRRRTRLGPSVVRRRRLVCFEEKVDWDGGHGLFAVPGAGAIKGDPALWVQFIGFVDLRAQRHQA